MTSDTSQRLEDLTVADLRRLARERGLKRYSKMKKAQLVAALQRTAEQGDEWSQHEARAEEQPAPSTVAAGSAQGSPWAGNGSSDERSTVDHDEIRAWAAARNALPATEQDTSQSQFGILRFRFGTAGPEPVEHVDWSTWLRTFDTLRLRFVYVLPVDGSQSYDFRLVPQ